jgi:hypothetical protein
MVITDDAGNHCLNITTAPDGGSLKNEGSERIVPLHPDLIADGFLEFVKTRGKGPLFYGGSKGKAAVQLRDDQKHPSKGVSEGRLPDLKRLELTGDAAEAFPS